MSRVRRTRFDATGTVHPLFWALLTDAVPLDDPRRRDPTLKWRFWEYGADMELGYGRDSLGYIAKMWTENRDHILHHWCRDKPGTRPQAFWRFEVPDHQTEQHSEIGPPLYGPPAGVTETEYLDRHGLLTDGERKRLHGVAPPTYGANIKIRSRT